MRRLTFRLCAEGDEQRLSDFHREAWGQQSSPALWRWKYFDNPAGRASIAIALDGSRIVGRLGSIPLRVAVGPDTVVAHQHLDSDILPGYRKGGTYFMLAGIAQEDSERSGAAFHFGFATRATEELSGTSLGFDVVAPVRRLVKVLDPFRLVASRLGIPGLGRIGQRLARTTMTRPRSVQGVEIRESDAFDARIDDLWRRSDLGWVRVVRDALHLRWRYTLCPGVQYRTWLAKNGKRISGALVHHSVRSGGITRGIIADVLCDPGSPEVVDALLDHATDSLSREGASSVSCWIPRGHWLHDRFRSRGFRDRPSSSSLVLAAGRSQDPRLAHVRREERWYYAIGDSDYHLTTGESRELAGSDVPFHR